MQINLGSNKFTLNGVTRTPTPVSAPATGVGCSGSDPHWNNGGLAWVVGQMLGQTPTFNKCTTPGSPITWHMTNEPSFGTNSWTLIANYACLHIGDNPLLDGIHDPSKLNQWAQRMWTLGNGGNGGNGGELLLWTLQPVYSSTYTTLQATIAANQAEYNIAQDYCNARMPLGKKPVRQIPGLQLFAKFAADQQAGTAPTATWFADLYIDSFHMVDGKVAYIDSVISAACMYGIDPKTMPNDMQSPTGFTVAEAQYIKNCVSSVVKAFGTRSGVNTSGWLA